MEEISFEKAYIQEHFRAEAEHARCLELEAQLNSIRDAARKVVDSYLRNRDYEKEWVFVEALQDELNKE